MKLNQYGVVAVGMHITHQQQKIDSNQQVRLLRKTLDCKNKIVLPLFSRSTLVNKEPDSMLAHMFKDKG